MTHRDETRQVVGDQVGTDDSNSLATAAKLVERLLQRHRDIGSQRPGPARRGQKVVFAGAQRDRRFDRCNIAMCSSGSAKPMILP